jgi:SET domain-containing protein
MKTTVQAPRRKSPTTPARDDVHTGASGTRADARQTVKQASPRVDARRIQVRRSGVHGKGVYALRPIRASEVIIEYTGEVISWREALRRHPHDPKDPHHTFYFHVDEKRVIDAKFGGNASRWINHACEPNCEADEVDGRVFIKALRDLQPGEELFYDYGLVIDERYTPALKREYACRCGSARCRGTMLAPRRRSPGAG